MERPNGELYKIQFKKAITLIGRVTYDEKTNLFCVQGIDKKNSEYVISYISPNDIVLLEDANEVEQKRFERYESSI